MLYTKIQPLSTGEEDFFLTYMGMAAILFNDAETFEQSVNVPSTEGPMWNLVKKLVKWFQRRRRLKTQ